MCVRARTPVDPWLGSSILEGRDPDGRLGLTLLLPEPSSEHKARKVPGNFSSISGHKQGAIPRVPLSGVHWKIPHGHCLVPHSACLAQGLPGVQHLVGKEVCAPKTESQNTCFILSIQLLCRSLSVATSHEEQDSMLQMLQHNEGSFDCNLVCGLFFPL